MWLAHWTQRAVNFKLYQLLIKVFLIPSTDTVISLSTPAKFVPSSLQNSLGYSQLEIKPRRACIRASVSNDLASSIGTARLIK